MHRTRRRLFAVSTATLAALALAAAPAMAGEDDDEGDDTSAQATPVPVQGDDNGSGDLSGAPQGGIATGAGGTAPQGPDGVLLGLSSGALVLIATGGGLVAASRRAER